MAATHSVSARLEFARPEHAHIVATAVGVERERRADILRVVRAEGSTLHVFVAAGDARRLRTAAGIVMDALQSAVDVVEHLSEEALADNLDGL